MTFEEDYMAHMKVGVETALDLGMHVVIPAFTDLVDEDLIEITYSGTDYEAGLATEIRNLLSQASAAARKLDDPFGLKAAFDKEGGMGV